MLRPSPPVLAEASPPPERGHRLTILPSEIPTAFNVVRAWIVLSVGVNVLGWLLATTGQLTARGYLVGFFAGAVLFWWDWRRRRAAIQGRRDPVAPSFTARWRRRWRRPLPFIFAVLLVLNCVGAALYSPNNYDALTYRVPQILHWLAAHRWHWAAVSDHHLNITPPGQGWFLAPMIAILKTDRLFALPNLAAFALLPGLCFTVLRECHVRARVAWYWMWLLPVASCFAMQAGGIGNDLLATAYALASVALGLRAARRNDRRDFFLSALAAALTTGIKITAAPLVLPWLVATWPCWRLIPRRWFRSAIVAVVALVISYVPIAVLNIRYTGCWNGDPQNSLNLRIDSPLQGAVGNSLMILTGALEPPLCPFAGAMKPRFQAIESSAFATWLRAGYPRFSLGWGELASEESSGLGLGLTVLASLSLAGGWARKRPGPRMDVGAWIGVASVIGFGAYLAKMGSEAAPRLASPFYPFLLIPLLRAHLHEHLVRQRWWRILAVLVALAIVPAVVLTPARPLWPAESVLAWLTARFPGSALLARARLVYHVYAHRDDIAAPLQPLLPSDGREVGYVREENGIEAPLWKPYGSRRIVEVLPPAPDVSKLAGSVIIGSSVGIQERFGLTPDAFAAKVGGSVIGKASIDVKVSTGPMEWVVIALPRPSDASRP